MSIGSTIKRLRRERDMTQERLAELLNLTPAAISGWECDRNSPDISQLPLLSRIFGVSADVLLGIDLAAQEDEIDKIVTEARKCSNKEAVEIYRRGLAQFPTSYRLMLHLTIALDYEGEPETYNSRMKEIIGLYERMREGSEYYKNYAEGNLCRIYLNQGKRDEAVKIAEGVPQFMFSRNDFERMLAQGKEKVYCMHHNILNNFMTLCDDIYFFTMLDVEEKPFFTHRQAISMLEKIPKMYEIFFENRDYLNDSGWLAATYTRMAEHYAELNDATNTLRCIELALKNAKEMDAYYKGLESRAYGISDVWDYPQLPKEKRHTSILANPDFDYPTATLWMNKGEESEVDCLLRDLSHERFDFVRDKIHALIELNAGL